MNETVRGAGQREGNGSGDAARVAAVGVIVNLLLTAVKLAAGIMGRSRAVIADAVESMADIPAGVAALIGVLMGGKPADETHDYGHGKIETLSAAFIGFSMVAAGAWILVSGVTSVVGWFSGRPLPRPGLVALLGAGSAVVVKEWLFRYTEKSARASGSQALHASAWHHRTDAFTSVGTLLGVGGALLLGDRWRVLDPATAALLSLLIIRTGATVSLESVNQLLEASESPEMEARMIEIMREVPGVRNPHHLRTRRIGNRTAIEAHLEVEGSLSVEEGHEVADQVEARLRESFGDTTHVVLHVEPDGYREKGKER